MNFPKNSHSLYALQCCHNLQVSYCQLGAISDATESGLGKATAKNAIAGLPRSLSYTAPSCRSPCTSGDSQQAILSSLIPPCLFVWEGIVHWIYVKMETYPFPQCASPLYVFGHDKKQKEVDKSQPMLSSHIPGNGSFSSNRTLQPCSIHISSGIALCCDHHLH